MIFLLQVTGILVGILAEKTTKTDEASSSHEEPKTKFRRFVDTLKRQEFLLTQYQA